MSGSRPKNEENKEPAGTVVEFPPLEPLDPDKNYLLSIYARSRTSTHFKPASTLQSQPASENAKVSNLTPGRNGDK